VTRPGDQQLRNQRTMSACESRNGRPTTVAPDLDPFPPRHPACDHHDDAPAGPLPSLDLVLPAPPRVTPMPAVITVTGNDRPHQV